ncbi:MAG: hypothetical protein J6V74_02955 [Bacteroidales bacterium]|nr:hypothetical protein [Bacteroidales bacterium]
MDYEYDERTGTFKNIPDNDDSNYYQDDDSDDGYDNSDEGGYSSGNYNSNYYDDISTITKVIFSFICMLCNYVAYRIGWGWLFLTIPMTIHILDAMINELHGKSYRIKAFIGFIAIMVTIVTPWPWWSVLIAVVADGIMLADKSNKIW